MKKLLTLCLIFVSFNQAFSQSCPGLELSYLQRNPFMPTFWTIAVSNSGQEIFGYPGFRIYDANTNELLGEEEVFFFGIGAESIHNVNVGFIAEQGVNYDLRVELWTDFYSALACEFEWSGEVYPSDFECVEVEFQFQIANWQSFNDQEDFTWVLSTQEGEFLANETLSILIPEPVIFRTVCMPIGCHVFNLSYLGEENLNTVFVNMYSAEFPLPNFSLTMQSGQSSINTAYEVYNCLETSVPEQELNTWSLFPNPAANEIGINGVEPGSEYRMMDLQGRAMRSGKLDNIPVIDVSELMSGIYILVVNGSAVRFIKE